MKHDSDGVFTRDDRRGFWISWTDVQGRRRYRKTNAETLQAARKLRAAEVAKVEQTRALGFAPPGDETFEDVTERYLKHQKVRVTPQAFERERGIVETKLRPFFSGRLAAIRRADVQRYITKRSAQVSAHSVVKELNTLKHLFRLAVEWELIPYSPVTGLKSPKVPAGRVRYLQPTELAAVVGECAEWLRPIVIVAVTTGMRRSEVLSLRWLDLDFHNCRALLPQTKNGEGRIVYLNKLALAALASCASSTVQPTGRVFQDCTPAQASMAFARACRRTGIADFRWHDLRHTAASWLRMSGADIHTVAQLLGHKDLRMAARYQHLAPDFLAAAVNRLDGVFGDLRYPGVTTSAGLIEAPSASA